MEINFWEMSKGLLSILRSFWPLLVLLILILIIRIMFEVVLPNEFKKLKAALRFKKGEKWRSDRDYLNWLRGMKPKEFEEYIAVLFSKLGYKTEVTGGAYDRGVDVIAEKDGIKHYVQCKKYFEKHEVGVGSIRDFYGAIADHLANGKGYFITTNKFTLEAERFAGDKPIELIDGFKLLKYIHLTEKGAKETGMKLCPKCGGELKERKGEYGKFLGCSNYPKCQYTENIRK